MSPGPSLTSRLQRFAAVCGLSALVLLLAACKPGSEPTKPLIPQAVVGNDSITFPKDSPQLGTLKIAQAQPEQESFVRINGRASWNDARTSRVNSPVNGRVVDLPVMPGAQVRKGTVLAVVSSPEFGQIQSEARRAESDYKLAERTLLRVRELHGAGVVPTKDLQIAEADHERARAERTRTQVRERSYGGGMRVDQMFKIVAPIAGVVVDRRVTIGQEVRAD